MTEPAAHEIRADLDRQTIAIYQANSPVIADAALVAQRDRSPKWSQFRSTRRQRA
jgi:Domain of unknown function (DUF4291)